MSTLICNANSSVPGRNVSSFFGFHYKKPGLAFNELPEGRKPAANPLFDRMPRDLHYNWDSLLLFSLIDTTLLTRDYDNSGKLLEQKWTILKQSGMGEQYRETNIYGPKGTLDTTYWEMFQLGQWWLFLRDTYTRDNNGNVTVILEQNYSGGSYTDQLRVTYTYNQEGMVLTETLEQETGGVLANLERYEYTRDSFGNYTVLLAQVWNETAWLNYSLQNITYNAAGNPLVMNLQQWVGTSWIDRSMVTYTYDDRGNNTGYLRQVFIDNAWINNRKITSSFNAAGKPLSSVYELWNKGNSSWFFSFRSTYSYEVSGYPGSRLDETMDTVTGLWNNYGLIRYTYDAIGNSTDCIYQQWTNNQWRPGLGYLDLYSRGEEVYSVYGYCQYKATFTSYFNGIGEPAEVSSFSVNPNPAADHLRVVCSRELSFPVLMAVVDLQGREVLSFQIGTTETTVNIGSLPPGIYFLKTKYSADGHAVRFIKAVNR